MNDVSKWTPSEQSRITDLLEKLDANPLSPEADFIRFDPEHPQWVEDALNGFGISVHRQQSEDHGSNSILCLPAPPDRDQLNPLIHALKTIFSPSALLFDLDGVLADVSGSYRLAIRETAASFGVDVTLGEIAEAKREGNANNDWVLTRRLIEEQGTSVNLEEVTEEFERLYHGTEDRPGFHEDEKLLVNPEWLAGLSNRYTLGIVTGRPRRDANRFLKTNEIDVYIDGLISMDDVKHVKPDPEPVLRCLDLLETNLAWLVGDTPDDMEAASEAGVLAVGVVPPEETMDRIRPVLKEAGASRVFKSAEQITNVLP